MAPPADAAGLELGFVSKTAELKTGEVVAYLEKGDRHAERTLLALHGMTMDRVSFASFVAALQIPDGVRVLIPDAMGHGSRLGHAVSLGPKYAGWTATERADDAAAFLAALGDVRGPVDVYGFSMGGATALAMAANHPASVDRVVLLAPAAAFTESILSETGRGHIRFNYQTAEQAVEFLEVIGVPAALARAGAPAAARERAAAGAGDEYWARTWLALVGRAGPDAAAMLAACRATAAAAARAGKAVAVIQGSADMVIHEGVPGAIQEAFGLERCQVTTLPGVGHLAAPADAQRLLAAEAGPVAAEFLGYDAP